MAEEIDIEDYSVLEDPAQPDVFSDIDLYKEEILNYDQEIEVQRRTSGETNQNVTQFENPDFPRVVKVEHNSFSIDIEILHEVEEPIDGDEKPDLVDLENEINVLRTPVFEFEAIFKQLVDQEKIYNVNVVLTDLDRYLLSSSRFCSYCLTLFPTKNALEVHMNSLHPVFNKIKNEICKYKSKTVICNKTDITSNHLNSNIFKSESLLTEKYFIDYKRSSISQRKTRYDLKNACSHCMKIFSSKQALMKHKQKTLQRSTENNTNFKMDKMCKSLEGKTRLNKCVVVLNRSQIAKSIKTHGRLKISKSLKKASSKSLDTDSFQARTCLNKSSHKLEYRYRCNICSYYFATARLLSLHLTYNHGFVDSYPDEGNITKFDPKCKFCARDFLNPLLYNKHVWRLHRKYFRNKNHTSAHSIDSESRRKQGNEDDYVETKANFGTEEFVQENNLEQNSMDLDIVQVRTEEVTRELGDAQKVYKCYICSFYSREETTHQTHLAKNHEVTEWDNSNIFKKCSFDKECIYCAQSFESEELYNTHLFEWHTEQLVDKVGLRKCAKIQHDELNSETNIINSVANNKTCEYVDDMKTTQKNTISYILKSVYFKCLKCDIYFLSSNIATNHKDHLEMLINWKCSICNLVFKKEDELMHELQHAFTENFTVFGVLPGDQIRILYNCLKCTVHFDGDNFLKHCSICENCTPHSKYCRDCDILIAECINKAHEQSHSTNKLTANDFIIVETDVIPALSTANKTISKKESSKYNDITTESLKFYYCKICKCYLNTLYNSQVHIQGKCDNLKNDKVTCQYCGLMFVSNKCTQKHLGQIHKKWRFISLNNFDFYDLEKKPITPPVPNYMECKKCNICFSIKHLYLRHKCDNVDFCTCNLCEKKYEKRTFQLHMQFHNYSKIDVSLVTSRESNIANVNTEKELSGLNTSELNVTEPKQLSVANRKRSLDTNAVVLASLANEQVENSSNKPNGPHKKRKKRQLVRPDKFEIYYCSICESCRHSFKTVKKHSPQLCPNMSCSHCDSCGLKFPETSFETHRKMHAKVKELDINYFTFYDHEGNPIAPPLPKYAECKKCNVHFFRKLSLIRHDCGNTDYEECGSCEIKYDIQSIKHHMSFHNYSRKDIPSDNLHISSNMPVSHGSAEIDNIKKNYKFTAPNKKKTKSHHYGITSQKKNIKRLQFYTMYICEKCKSFTHCAKSLKFKTHSQGTCADLIKKKSAICKICGIQFSWDNYLTHKNLHEMLQREVNFNEFNFYNAQHERIVPPIPRYKQCKKCDLTVITHHKVCAIEQVTCNVCKVKYDEETFKLHMLFHDYDKNRKESEHSEPSHVTPSETVKNDQCLLETKANVYEEGIIYRCEACCLAVDTYDKVIEHCQEHLMMVPETVTETCEKCKLQFSVTCYQRHRDLHTNHESEHLFVILNFDIFYFSTARDIWIKHILGPLPLKQQEKILSLSIYNQEHRIRMEILQNGSGNCTVYKCDRCCCIIAESKLLEHTIKLCSKKTTDTYACSACSLLFNSEIARKEHEGTHLQTNINYESYKIVSFNRKKDRTLNKLLLYHHKYFILYQCRICGVSADCSQTTNHECKQKSLLKSCPKCALLLSFDDYDLHILRHNRVETFSSENIKIILFGEAKVPLYNHNFKGSVHDYKLIICSKCQAGFSKNSIMRIHNCDLPRKLCPVCKYYIGGRLAIHMSLHDEDPMYTRKNITVISMRPLAYKNILENTDDEFDFTNDDQLHLNFNDSNHIETVTETQYQPVKKDIVIESLIYICISCNIAVDAYDHVIEHCHAHSTNKESEIITQACNLCEIKIEKKCYEKHQALHLCYQNDDFFTVLKYDTFYFSADKTTWTKHVLGLLPLEQTEKIIRESIYGRETKLKLKLIQDGPADLTVYKCNKCSCIFDDTNLKDHTTKSCSKQDTYQCSDCSLYFNSIIARKEHQQIHTNHLIDIKSYKIVSFNGEEDNNLNRLLIFRSTHQNFLLYQCRACNVVVDRPESRVHTCGQQQLKKCRQCTLLFRVDHFNAHLQRHKNITSFTPQNIKIILFGEAVKHRLTARSFKGVVCDYWLYKCLKCHLCSTWKLHKCIVDYSKNKCNICQLYIKKINEHMELHEADPDFGIENITIISVEPQKKHRTIKKEKRINPRKQKLCDIIEDTDEEEYSSISYDSLDEYPSDTEDGSEGDSLHNRTKI